MKKQLEELHKYEIAGETDLDRVAGCFGKLMEELFVYKKDCWEPTLREFGFFLGKFIYILDAYDDLEEDKKSGSYNPLLTVEKRYGDKKEAFEQDVQQILTMMISNAAAAFERLPCIEDAQIIKNILYAGVWARYNKIQKEKQERNSKNDK